MFKGGFGVWRGRRKKDGEGDDAIAALCSFEWTDVQKDFACDEDLWQKKCDSVLALCDWFIA